MTTLANHSPSPASSSAVTIPTPGKSILKRPPPPPQSLFSRLTKLLPSQNVPASGTAEDESRTLKRAHFILPQLATVYPITAANPPFSPAIKEEKKLIEEMEAERRKRVVRRNSVGSSSHELSESDEWWQIDQVESFYRECSIGREETPDPAISAALKVRLLYHPNSATCMYAIFNDIDSQRAASPDSRTVDLSGVQITVPSATILSDVLTIEWGLRKLIVKECNLDEHVSIRSLRRCTSDLLGRISNPCYTHC
jgi:protein phosphatase 1 regulatory subunit 37